MNGPPATPASGYGMISVEEAQNIVLRECPVLPTVTLKTRDSIGYVAAADITAPEPLPPFPASIKDGYAVNCQDGPGEYPVEKACFAGESGAVKLQPGTVDYIATGAPVPDGADAVVQIEDTEFLGELNGQSIVKIKVAATPGLDIRPVGSDIETGAQVVSKGDVIGAAEIGLLATIASVTVDVVRKPKVAVMSTGDELLDFDSEKDVKFGEIRDSNRPLLLAACQERGFESVDLAIVKDEEAELKNHIQTAISNQCDIIVCSGTSSSVIPETISSAVLNEGGVSMGSKDTVKPVLESMGTVHFGKVKMKPGKPITFATIKTDDQTVLFFGLPGNPVSSYSCFHLFVLPALHKLQGWHAPLLRRVQVVLDSSVTLDPVRPEFARAIAKWKDGRFYATTTGNQISSRLLSARSANVLLELPQKEGTLEPGSEVPALVVDDLRAMPI